MRVSTVRSCWQRQGCGVWAFTAASRSRCRPQPSFPAPGQGIVAVEIRADDIETRTLVELLDDAPAGRALTAERALVAALGGGCQTPIGALAADLDGDRLELVGDRDRPRRVAGHPRERAGPLGRGRRSRRRGRKEAVGRRGR